MLGLLMSVNMDWFCIVTTDGKRLHTALGYTAEEAREKAATWRENHLGEYREAVVGEPRLQFQRSA
jgi:hypothetical protein